jgi:hypothetical protein
LGGFEVALPNCLSQPVPEMYKNRNIEDRKMGCRFIFLSSIFLSAFAVRLRLCRAALTGVPD